MSNIQLIIEERAADIGKGTPVEQGAVGTIRLRPAPLVGIAF